MKNEKLEFEILDLHTLRGKRRYKKFIELDLLQKRLDEYKKYLSNSIKSGVSQMCEHKFESDNGTIYYYDKYTKEQINKDKAIEKFGRDALDECISTINVSDRLVVKGK